MISSRSLGGGAAIAPECFGGAMPRAVQMLAQQDCCVWSSAADSAYATAPLSSTLVVAAAAICFSPGTGASVGAMTLGAGWSLSR
eukprot:CAMPEP_0178726956 /NCGR_PEP_ID=MMETSP0699-20121125/27602_1 /TAXON_ID=265572 /ORGANISM="Extubocellulus spinifer, Strain CCMP396" /LENGTH=84 /DNA_ID=CAMNT_0020378629 /DNA_START=16 /DNA_END=267 /DNA_ORIENTATION=-